MEDRAEQFYNEGINFIQKGQYSEAITSFDKAIAINPDYVNAWFNRGIAQAFLGQSSESVASYDKAIAIIPDFVEAWISRGSELDTLGQYSEAIVSYDKANAINPNYVEAWYLRGVSLDKLGKYSEAVASYDKAIAINPDYAEAWIGRGSELDTLGQYSEAVASYDKANAINPNYVEAWYLRGVALGKLGKYSEAVASYDKAIAINPDYTEAWIGRGSELDTLGQYSEAVASYDKAIAIKSDYVDAWNKRGVSLDKLGKYSEAVASYDKAIAINPDYVEAWINRGVSLDKLGKYSEAVASYDKAIAIKPDHVEAWYNRGSALNELCQYSEAVASYDKAIAINPDYTEAWNNRGIALTRLGQYSEAVASYDKAIAIKPDSTKARNNREIALEKLSHQVKNDLRYPWMYDSEHIIAKFGRARLFDKGGEKYAPEIRADMVMVTEGRIALLNSNGSLLLAAIHNPSFAKEYLGRLKGINDAALERYKNASASSKLGGPAKFGAELSVRFLTHAEKLSGLLGGESISLRFFSIQPLLLTDEWNNKKFSSKFLNGYKMSFWSRDDRFIDSIEHRVKDLRLEFKEDKNRIDEFINVVNAEKMAEYVFKNLDQVRKDYSSPSISKSQDLPYSQTPQITIRQEGFPGYNENLISAACYFLLWVTGIILFLLWSHNKTIRFHALQSILTFLPLNILFWIFGSLLTFVSTLIGLLIFVLWLVLMIKAYQGEKYKLPFVGDIAESLA